MTKFHIQWHKNLSLIPKDPAEMAKYYLSMLEMVKAELKSRKLTDWGTYCDMMSGYCIAEGTEADIIATLAKWTPYVQFDVKPVASADQAVEAINKAVAESKPK